MGVGFDTMREYRGLVAEVKRRKGDFIKIMAAGIMDFNQFGVITGEPLGQSEIREMIHIAHEEGFAVMVHGNTAQAVRDAAFAGADSIEHGNYLDRDCIQALADSGTVWVPTLSTIRNLIGCGRFPDEELKKIYDSAAENLRRAYDAGVMVALGSDAGAYRVPHGQGIEDEFAAFKEILGDSKELRERLEQGEARIREKFVYGRRKTK